MDFNDALQAVRQFMEEKTGVFTTGSMPRPVTMLLNVALRDFVVNTKYTIQKLEELQETDPAALRFSLIFEELTELVQAYLTNDTVEYADAVADLLYVFLGLVVLSGLPLQGLFEEVHASNMTKGGDGTHRMYEKGKDYKPPNIRGVLNAYGISCDC